MTRPVRLALIQTARDAADPSENLHDMLDHLHQHVDADLVLFPELALHGHEATEGTDALLHRALRAVDEHDLARLHDAVRTTKTPIVYGRLLRDERGLHNVATYTDGTTVVDAAKMHVHWTETFTPGGSFVVATTPLGPTGFLICFDAAFPEVPRRLALAGATAIVNLSAIPDHFPLDVVHRRVQAASVQNQVFGVFVNRRGPGFSGGSMVVDPLGRPVATAGPNDEAITVEIDLDAVDEWRRAEPLLPHRRPELYGIRGEPATPGFPKES